MNDPALFDGLVDGAVDAAHRALVRLEDTDVPAALRPVRAASKKRQLPLPLRRTLLAYLEEAWLRDLALVELAEDDEPGHLFLARPDGWEERLEELARHREENERLRQRRNLSAELEHLRTVNTELGLRLEQATDRIAELERRLADDERVQSLRRQLGDANRTVERLEGSLQDARQRAIAVEAELAEADERIEALRSRLAKARSATVQRSERDRRFGRGDPVETARFLDELVDVLRPVPDEPTSPPAPTKIQLPAGIRPDEPEAVDWLLRLERRVVVAVDGHNVAHDLAGPDRVTRDRIVWTVARLQRLADGPLAPVIFFDTPQEAESYRNSRVAVRYVPDADDAIVELVKATDDTCVVITTDKELRDRVSAHGAVTLWGTALSAWMRRR